MVKVAVAHCISDLSSRPPDDAVAREGFLIGMPPTERMPYFKALHMVPTQGDSVSLHCKQILRMLPGGLEILGFYAISSESGNNHAKISSLYKSLKKLKNYTKLKHNLIYMNISPDLITCKVFDEHLKESKCDAVELVKERMATVQTFVDLSGVSVPDLKDTSEAWRETLQTALVLLDDKLPSTEDTYEESEKVAIIIPRLSSMISTTEENKDFLTHVHTKGLVAVRAYLCSGDSSQVAAEALSVDIIRTISSRIEMHVDSIIEEQDLSSKVFHELPRRIFLNYKNSFSFCDYLFPSEGIDDSKVTFKEVLNITKFNENTCFEEPEETFDPEELSHQSSMDSIAIDVAQTPTRSLQRIVSLALIGAFLIAVVAIILPRLILA